MDDSGRKTSVPDWVRSAAEPISAESPAGEYLRGDPDYDAIREEINDINNPHRSAPPDWGMVLDRGTHLLAKRSKDLRVAVYVAVASFETGGYAGLRDSLEVLATFLERYWDILFPPRRRLRARVGVLSWFFEWLHGAIRREPPALSQFEEARACADLLNRCSEAIRAVVADSPPTGANARRLLGDMLRVLEQKAAAERKAASSGLSRSGEKPAAREAGADGADSGARGVERAESQVSSGAMSGEGEGESTPQREGGRGGGTEESGPGGGGGERREAEKPVPRTGPGRAREGERAGGRAREAGSGSTGRDRKGSAPSVSSASTRAAGQDLDEEVERRLKQVARQVAPLTEAIRRSVPGSPVSYQVSRALVWAQFVRLPPAKEGKTRIAPPASGEVQHLERAFEAGDMSGVLEMAESRFMSLPLWLDLQWWSWRALQALGEPYGLAAEVIQANTRWFVSRLPGVDTLQFRDGTPFVGDQTRRWLARAGRTGSPRSGPPSSGRPSGLEPRGESSAGAGSWNETLKEARALVQAGRGEDAVSLLQARVDALPYGKDRFRGHLDLARIALELGWATSASKLLEALDTVAIRHRLEEWDRPLMAELLATRLEACLARGGRGGKGSGTPDPEVQALLDRLARIDIATAIKFDKN